MKYFWYLQNSYQRRVSFTATNKSGLVLPEQFQLWAYHKAGPVFQNSYSFKILKINLETEVWLLKSTQTLHILFCWRFLTGSFFLYWCCSPEVQKSSYFYKSLLLIINLLFLPFIHHPCARSHTVLDDQLSNDVAWLQAFLVLLQVYFQGVNTKR